MGDKAVDTTQKQARRPEKQRATPAPVATLISPEIDIQRAMLDPGHARPADILGLQQRAGNRAVSHLIQTKLSVGPPADRYEQEADRVAELVLSSPVPVASSRSPAVQRQMDEEEVQTKPLAATITPLVQRQMDEEEVQTKPLVQRQMDEEEVQTKPLVQRQMDEEEVQTKPLIQRQMDEEEVQTKRLPPTAMRIAIQRYGQQRDEAGGQIRPLLQRRSNGGFDAPPDLENRLATGRGNGRPLASEVRAYMEPRFGADFGGVRVHTGAEADSLNHQIRAQAFTHGSDIYLGKGRYEPETDAGKHLLAHELAHVVQQGKATPQRGPAQTISRRPAAAIQRNGGRLSAGAHRVGTAIGSAGTTIKEGAISAGETIAEGATTAGTAVKGAVIAGGKALKELLQPGAEYVAEKATAAANYVKNKLWSVHLGLRDVEIKPVEKPKSLDNVSQAHDYAGQLLYAIDGHKFETTRNLRFLEQDKIAIQEHLDQTLKDIDQKKQAIDQVKEPTGRTARLKKTAQEQKAKLRLKLYDLNQYKNQLQDELPKADARVAQARLGEDIVRENQLDAGVTYDGLLQSTKVGSNVLTETRRNDISRMAQKEEQSLGVRLTVAKASNVVRESGRSERFFTNGIAKLVGGKVANIALQTGTLTLMSVQSKDRPGGYSSTIKVTNIFSKTKAELQRLKAISTANLYGNKGATGVYIALKGASTVVIAPLRDLAGAISLLSTLIGTALGVATLGAAAAPFVMASTITGYIALGLTGLNGLLNTALAIWNGIRMKALHNQRKRSALAAETSETASTGVTELLSAGAQGMGVGLNVGLTGQTMGSQAASDIARGVRLEDKPLWITIASTGPSKGLDILAQAVPSKVAGAVSPTGLGYKEAHQTGLLSAAYKPHGSHGVSIGGHKVGVPHPKFATETAPEALGAAKERIGQGASWVGGKIATGAQTAAHATATGAKWVGGKVATGAETVGMATVQAASDLRDLSEKEWKEAREWLTKDLPSLVGRFASSAGEVAAKIGKILPSAKSAREKFATIKEKLTKSKKVSQKEENGIELADMGQSMGDSITDLLGQLPETIGEGVAWATAQAK